MTIEEFNSYLKLLIKYNGSDIHISAGNPIYFRINGKLLKVENSIVPTREQLVSLIKFILRSRWDDMVKYKNVDFNYKLNSEISFRGNTFFQQYGPSIVMRVIPSKIPSLESLNLPKIINKFINLERGLFLVTGITGSGKSTTLAALINEINKKHYKHILTIEDPIEYVYKSEKSLISQRSVGEDAESFPSALKAALREDPDIILIGEIRDKETLSTTLKAAETGHLVFSTLHTLDSKETISRILSLFPIEEENNIRNVLANTLQCVISQRLVPTKQGKRTAVMEILINTPRIKKLILEKRENEIRNVLDEGHEIYGTQSFDRHLIEKVLNDEITEETALKFATNPKEFELNLRKEMKKKFNKENDDNILKIKEEK